MSSKRGLRAVLGGSTVPVLVIEGLWGSARPGSAGILPAARLLTVNCLSRTTPGRQGCLRSRDNQDRFGLIVRNARWIFFSRLLRFKCSFVSILESRYSISFSIFA